MSQTWIVGHVALDTPLCVRIVLLDPVQYSLAVQEKQLLSKH